MSERMPKAIRFTRSEWALIRRAAKLSKRAASTFVRESGVARARRAVTRKEGFQPKVLLMTPAREESQP